MQQQKGTLHQQCTHVGAVMTAMKNLFSLLPHRSLLGQATYSVAAECLLGRKKL